MKEEFAEAMDALRAYSYERRADFARAIDEQVAEWDREVEQLVARGEDAIAEARSEVETRAAELRRARERLAQELEALGSAGEEAWRELRSGIVDAMMRMDQALERARSARAEEAEAQRAGG